MDTEQVIARARTAFSSGVTRKLDFRRAQLESLIRLVEDNADLINKSLKVDFQKPPFETVLTEADFVKNEALGALYSLQKWTSPLKPAKNLVTMFDEALIVPEPYGVVLIIGAWNYPLQLTLLPLIGAIAAGNVAILKPSEVAPATAKFIKDLLPRYLHKDCYQVVNGGADVTSELLKHKFDYIFYTGSTVVGKIIYQEAAKHLTPVTLELGGKSPVYIDENLSDLTVALKRLLWGKCLNGGQTCIAPDYVLCTPKTQEKIKPLAKSIIDEFYGSNRQSSTDFARIISDKHFDRLKNLVDKTKGEIITGGQMDKASRYLEPIVVANVPKNDSLMSEEIFGPILPLLTVSNEDEAIRLINEREKPLTLYLFSENRKLVDKFLAQTSSGSVCVNDTMVHLTVDTLPFGGVGLSGLGSYHGKRSFDTFSHSKSILIRDYNPYLEAIGAARYPPYNEANLAFFQAVIAKSKGFIPANWMYISSQMLGVAIQVTSTIIKKMLFK